MRAKRRKVFSALPDYSDVLTDHSPLHSTKITYKALEEYRKESGALAGTPHYAALGAFTMNFYPSLPLEVNSVEESEQDETPISQPPSLDLGSDNEHPSPDKYTYGSENHSDRLKMIATIYSSERVTVRWRIR